MKPSGVPDFATHSSRKLAMPTKPKQQRVDNQARLKAEVVKSFREWCELLHKATNEAAAQEFTADMDGTFEGV